MTRRSALITVGASLVILPRTSEGSTLSITRALRRMVGFQIVAADDVRQAWSDRGVRYIQLRQSGLFREVGVAIGVDPPGFSEAILFAKPRTRECRLLIDGEFYRVEAYE